MPPRRQLGQRLARLRQAHARLRRIFLADQTKGLRQRRAAQSLPVERRASGEEHVEQRAQRIDVGPCVDVQGAELRLLGAHVLERPYEGADFRVHRAIGEPLVQRLGHAEVDHLRHRLAVLRRDQHVGRLDVAMDDPLLVRVLDRVADRLEQLQPVADGSLPLVAVRRDGDAVDQLHHEVRQAGLGAARVQDGGDVPVVHQRQGLTFRLEALQDQLRVHARLDHLEGHMAPHGLGLLRHPDRSHAALAELLEQLVGPDADLGCRCDVVVGDQRLQAGNPGIRFR